MARSHKGRGQHRWPLLAKPVCLGWQVKAWITFAQALQMIAAGTAREIVSESGEWQGFEPCAPKAGTNAQGIGRPSAACVTAREMETFAGLRPSKTVGLTDAQRAARVAWGKSRGLTLAEHDAAEVLRAKVAAFRPVLARAS